MQRGACLVIVASALGGCTLLVSVDGLEGPPLATDDAAVDATAPEDARSPGDAPADVDGAGRCAATAESLPPPLLLGDAQQGPASAMQLTADVMSRAGALAFRGTFVFASFDVAFEASMTRPVDQNVGNGLAIFWRTVPDFPPACVAGGSRACLFGDADADGYGTVLRTSYTPQTSSPFVAVYRTSADPGNDPPAAGTSASFDRLRLFTVDPSLGPGAAATTAPPDASWHRVLLQVRGTRARLALDDALVLDAVLPAGPADVRGGLAIAASTGVTTARHLVRGAALTTYPASCTAF